MTQESSIKLLLAVFDDVDAAGVALDQLKQAQKARTMTVEAAAIVQRDLRGELQITEPSDPGGQRGALAGGLIGAVIGLLGGPGGAIVTGAAGALIGAVTAEIIDSGIPDQNLEVIGQSLLPGESAVVAIVDKEWQEQLERVMTKAGARVLSGDLTGVIAKQLQLPPSEELPTAEEAAGPDSAGEDRPQN
jgi:uncharacterized membrane protein